MLERCLRAHTCERSGTHTHTHMHLYLGALAVSSLLVLPLSLDRAVRAVRVHSLEVLYLFA